MTHGIARDQLRAFIERVERLEEEKKAIADDIKQVFAEAKSAGFDTKVMRQIVRIRKQDANQRAEFEAVLDLYLHALGMIGGGAGPGSWSGVEDGGIKESFGQADDDMDIREPIRAARKSDARNPYRDPVGFEVGEGA